MRVTRCGFLFKGCGLQSDRCRHTFEAPEFAMEIRGVASLEDGEAMARELVASGVQLLDLCGGFDETMIGRIVTAVEGKIPVGGCPLPPEETEKATGWTRYGFIFKGPGMRADRCRFSCDTPGFAMEIRGVSSPEEGEDAARDLVGLGIQLLELCGGFNEAMTARIAAAVEEKIPVNAIRYAPEEAEKLARFRALPEA